VGAVHRQLASLVERSTGFAVEEHLLRRVATHVGDEVRRRSLASPGDYLEMVRGGDAVLLDALVASVLVHETYFFRYASQLGAIERDVLPALLRRGDRRARLWSAGCSQGPEPYTLAMIALRAAGHAGREPVFEVLGTDVCEAFLTRARRAVYPESRLRDVPEELRGRHFERRPDGSCSLRPETRGLVELRRHNLLSPPPGRDFDLVLCRNVLMYFDPRSRRRALENLAAALAPDGVLAVGHSESLRDVPDLFVPHPRLSLGMYVKPASRVLRNDVGVDVDVGVAVASSTSTGTTTRTNERMKRGEPEVLALEGDYDVERAPERLEALKRRLSAAIDRSCDIAVLADGATSLGRETAVLIARASAAVAAGGFRLVVVATRPPVRSWAERNRLPVEPDGNQAGRA
jgi:chemotaxis methyl-accepting protein methylase